MQTSGRRERRARFRVAAIAVIILETGVVLVVGVMKPAVPLWAGVCVAVMSLGGLAVLVGTELQENEWRRTNESQSERLAEMVLLHQKDREETRHRRERIENVLEGTNYPSMVFQPIVDLRTMETVGFESLSRFGSGAPDGWFAQAAEVGLGLELELKAIRRALQRLDALPVLTYLAVNCSSATLFSAELYDLVSRFDGTRIVIEVTEKLPAIDYRADDGAVAKLRKLGVRLAIDDLGAGYATLSHVIELQPEIIKLDSRMADVGAQPVMAMVQTLVTLAGLTGATLIAEGLEDNANLELVRELGVNFGQGWHLGGPQSLEELLKSEKNLAATPPA